MEEPCDLTKAVWRKPGVRSEHSQALIWLFSLSVSGVHKVKTTNKTQN